MLDPGFDQIARCRLHRHCREAAVSWWLGAWVAANSTVPVIDKSAPTIVCIDRSDANPACAASANFLVTFSKSVTGVSSANFSLELQRPLPAQEAGTFTGTTLIVADQPSTQALKANPSRVVRIV